MSQQDPCTVSVGRRRAAVVGLGARARMFTEALTGSFADRIELVGLCDTNAHRMAVHNTWIAADHPGRVTLHCEGCSRTANYLVPGPESSSGRRLELPPP